MEAINVHGVSKAYGSYRLDAVDLSVATGEVFALLGPNGAGKSTLVEILEGHRRRDAGTVSVLGTDPCRADRSWRARIGIVLQEFSDVGDLTVSEALRHFARYYPTPADHDRLMVLCGLAGKRDARIATLSGGQRRRLDVALAVVGNPEVLFLDEPTTGFDPEARRQFWELIRDFAARGMTILLTTHYLEEAEALADRIAVLVGGRIVAEGTPATLGGRDRAGSTVTWRDSTGMHRLITDDPATVVQGLGAAVQDLSVTPRTLEDTYLDLIANR